MKLRCDPETDSLYIELRPGPGSETKEIADGVNVDLGREGRVVGTDIDHASLQLDLTISETDEVPLKATRIA
ncbi:MAG: DUF2283 domain-containing protein [Defluviicoccus sp.]|nr:DUF2283 domain-containing protein [Defluviicoccus sp.]